MVNILVIQVVLAGWFLVKKPKLPVSPRVNLSQGTLAPSLEKHDQKLISSAGFFTKKTHSGHLRHRGTQSQKLPRLVVSQCTQFRRVILVYILTLSFWTLFSFDGVVLTQSRQELTHKLCIIFGFKPKASVNGLKSALFPTTLLKFATAFQVFVFTHRKMKRK